MSYFENIDPVVYAGPDSNNPLSYRWYDKDRVVLGKRMEEHLRFSVCYWHSFAWDGFDIFGHASFERPWHRVADPMAAAKLKAEAAFELFAKLGVPYYTFHDRDVAPEGASPRESVDNFHRIVDLLGELQQRTGMKPLWGTANLFSHRRFMAGAATNPDPEIFAMAALQVREAIDATKRLGGQNYVMWGGREGYETLLNTDMKRELLQYGRFLAMAVDYKHKIGLEGPILIEPKPREPSKHQYDFDAATVYGFLLANGLEKEVKLNLECNHATLAGHSFEHEIATAQAFDLFGSIDMNRGDMQCGWDTDQFPNSLADTTLVLYYVLQGGGFKTGGINFDAKVRRQSIDAQDMFHSHVGAIDLCAKALLAAESMIQDGSHAKALQQRYAGWDTQFGRDILGKSSTLTELAERVLHRNTDISPVSGRQEVYENMFNRFC